MVLDTLLNIYSSKKRFVIFIMNHKMNPFKLEMKWNKLRKKLCPKFFVPINMLQITMNQASTELVLGAHLC